MFPGLGRFEDFGILAMRLIVGLVFFTSGWNHLKDPAPRAKSIGMSRGFTIFLGFAESFGGLGVAVGFATQLAALGLILIMFGAIFKKMFSWHTGIWGKHGTDGWHYDLMLALMNLVILLTNGGRFALQRFFTP